MVLSLVALQYIERTGSKMQHGQPQAFCTEMALIRGLADWFATICTCLTVFELQRPYDS